MRVPLPVSRPGGIEEKESTMQDARWVLPVDPEDDEPTPPAPYPEDDHAGRR